MMFLHHPFKYHRALTVGLLLVTFTSCIVQEKSVNRQEIFILTDNSTDLQGQFTDSRYGNVLGVIEWQGSIRVYYQNRGLNQAEYIESSDLISWGNPVPIAMDLNMFLFNDGDEIRCYRSAGEGDLVLYSEFDPVQGCRQRDYIAYNWKLDGQVSMNGMNGKIISTGRVRGNRSKKEGGWGNDLPRYPSVENYLEVEEAFKPFPYYNAADFLKDRRGISIHKSVNGKEWESKILADPSEFDLPGFRGWNNQNANGIADFYASTLVDEKRILIKVYWKKKDRLIDRSEYSDQFRDDIRRRYRFTGETTIIPGIIVDGKLRITSTESVISLDRFKRVVSDEVHWATAPEREEVGQFSLANRVLEKRGYVYLFFQYRDDVHYEFHESMYYSGIFVQKMKSTDFDALFEQGL